MHKSLKKEHQKIYIRSLAYILNIEKKPTDARMEYLSSKTKECALGDEECEGFKLIKVDDVIKQIKSIEDIRIRRFILREMILLAMADHELSDKEIANIYKIGTKSGIKEDKVSDFFLWAAKGVEWQIEGSKLIEEDL